MARGELVEFTHEGPSSDPSRESKLRRRPRAQAGSFKEMPFCNGISVERVMSSSGLLEDRRP